MDSDLKKQLEKIANTIRQLSMEAVQKANSGHPGLPMGCAEFAAFLWGTQLRHNPKNPKWLGRDRFILSAGHGSMLLYSMLHLSGYNLSIDDLKSFRQLHSKTPGHPEYHMTEGVEATTGPLGQGIANAVGQALALKLLGTKFNSTDFPLFQNKVFCLAGDGCIMEGISSEASSFAGHLGLNNLVLVYDSNHVCLDGPLGECCSEDTKKRYEAYGWDTYEIDGYDFDQLEETFNHIRENQTRPCLVVMHTVIGKGSPHKAGTSKAHGSPLGVEEVEEVKKILGLPEEEFYVPQSAYTFFEQRQVKCQDMEQKWKELFRRFSETNPALSEEFNKMAEKSIPADLEKQLNNLEIKNPIAGRSASSECLKLLGDLLPFLYGGSADLSGSDKTMMSQFPIVQPGKFEGRNIKFGVREFAMAAAATGMSQSDMIIPYVGTFLTFSDYMRNAIRLAALSEVQVVYQFTHDSIFLGEDGPTHQPIEHYAALRAIPNLQLIRPADANEVKMAWIAALRYRGPTAIILSRQNLPTLDETSVSYDDGLGKGAYILKKESSKADFCLIATGSEISLAMDVADALEKKDKQVRVVSMPCFEIFDKQSADYKKQTLGGDLGTRVSIEAGVSMGWGKWVGPDGISISIETFGASAPMSDLQAEYGFTVDAILSRLLS
ncbi:MAG: transketolase [Simkaniaceae bacterium]|nr:transketolase [Candidatus Sacchlamyda saccharinae]